MGAGPGDPGLLTIAGWRRLESADVVVYDALANPALLDLARPDAVRIDVGKRAGHHTQTQDQINALLVEHAAAGRDVVRLKGGDPYVFGRGAEEASFCAKHRVACEVIPGVTAGIAAPATAGIPVTQRGVSSSVTFVTAHEDPSRGETSLDYRALADLMKTGGTVCVYMGVGRLAAIVSALRSHGVSPDVPVAIVQWGTLPKQRLVRGTLDTIASEAERQAAGPPAIVVFGPVAGLDPTQNPGLNFFDEPTTRPLRGQTVVVTRTRTQQSDLASRLTALGADVLEAPTIRVAPAGDPGALVEAVGRWCVAERPADLLLTSANAVEAFAQALGQAGLDARALRGVRIGVVGAVTAKRLEERLALRADVVPPRANGRALAEALLERGGVAGRTVWLPRADVASSDLPARLRDAGADVEEIEAYRVVPADMLPPEVVRAFSAGQVDWVTFTSSSIAASLMSLLGPSARSLLSRCRLASIGPVTTASMRGLGLTPAVEAETASVAALAGVIAQETRSSRA